MYASRRRRRHRQRRLFAAGLFLILLLTAIAGFVALFATQDEAAETDRASQARVETPRAETPKAPDRNAPRSDDGRDDGRDNGRDGGAKSGQEDGPEAGPEAVKAIYLTAYSASGNLDAYLGLLDRTELNAAVVDVKDVTGEVMYPSEVPLANEIGATRDYIPDLAALVERLEERDVYSIARVAVFEDDILPRERPDLAVMDSTTGGPWLNNAGQSWTNAYREEAWEYNVAIAKEAAEAGFDEIQFDYIRFPSDGPMENIDYGEETYPTQADALAGFLEHAQSELPEDVRVAADVFGLAATEPGAGVGQFVDKLAPHLDVICPMAYPSHYPAGSYGYEDPNSEPYGVLENTMADFEKETKKANPDLEIRPWIQDFDLGTPPYGPREIRAQMRAIYDSGETGWLLWNPANDYTEAALKPE